MRIRALALIAAVFVAVQMVRTEAGALSAPTPGTGHHGAVHSRTTPANNTSNLGPQADLVGVIQHR